MNIHGIFSIARKEIRSYFLSPVAVIFLGIFLLITLFSFFTQSRFFIRGIADVRPLFQWMPLLLIFLVSAVTMRQWSEEQKMGTLEVLLTLPLRTSELVLGKFLAGLTLVSLALVLTLPLTISVASLGPLDSGPVIGGYLASLLLASSYLSIGLCVSAMSDNQIVSLMLTLLLCGLLYFLGSETLLSFVNQETGELLSALGSGSRFMSIERGVVDFRDLFYYLTVCGIFLYLNKVAIDQKRFEIRPTDRPSRWKASLITVFLLSFNLIVSNILLHDTRLGRIDLTEDQLYSVSDVTVEVIHQLDEQMSITGYFSERTHPLLAPLVPQIKDFLNEYQVRTGGQLSVQFIDPHTNEELEEEIRKSYGIKSLPISVADRTEMAFVNAYFHVLIRYGDEYKVLDFDDLIDIRRDNGSDGVELRLRGLEYILTKTIKSVSQDFLGLDALMASQPITLTTYMTAKSELPPELAELPDRLAEIFAELEERSAKNGGQVKIRSIDPATLSVEEKKKLTEEQGFVPIQLIDGGVYYLYGIIQVSSRSEGVMFLQKDIGKESLTQMIESAIRRSAPGFKKTIGLFTKKESADHPQMPFGQPPPPPKTDYRQLEQVLMSQFEVRRLTLKDELVPSDVDVLFVAKAGKLTSNQRFAIDQYLMGGGTLIALAGHFEIEPEMMQGNSQVPPTFKTKALESDLNQLLANYGVLVGEGLVADPQNLDIVYPVKHGFNRIRITQEGYPYFNQINRGDFPKGDHVTLAGLNSLSLLWPAPLSVNTPAKEVKVTSLLQSSEKSWIDSKRDLSPMVKVEESSIGRHTLALTLEGPLKSAFSSAEDRSSSTLYQELSRTGRTLNQAISGAKLAVIGSPDLLSDLGLEIGNYYTGLFGLRGDYGSSVMMAQNFVEWAVEDDSLTNIRTTGGSSRILRSINKEEQRQYELWNYIIALIALIGLTLLATLPRHFAAQAVSVNYTDQRRSKKEVKDQ